MIVSFQSSEHITEDIMSFHFLPDGNLDYTAGQFIQLALDHKGVDKRGKQRWFTLSSSPSEPIISITTKVGSQTSSFKNKLLSLKPGDKANINDPMGDFVLPMSKTTPIIFLAIGIGVTPVRSIIKWLEDQRQTRPITLIQTARSADRLAFKNLFKDSSVNYIPTIIKNVSDIVPKATDLLKSRLEIEPESLIYLSGPEERVEAIYKTLLSDGVSDHRLVTDYFHGYN